MVSMMNDNPEALKLAKSANASYRAGNVLGFIGGFLIGYPIGTTLGGGEPEWGMAAAGAGVIVVALPIISSANKKMSRAVDLYNSSESSANSTHDFQFKGNAVGLAFKF
jgi:uncharacterized membrane protein YedE/YeeE